MTCTEFDGYICIDNVTDLDLRQTLDCGQSFRWTENADGSFDGIAFGKKVRVRLDGERLYIENSNKPILKVYGKITLTSNLITVKSEKR